MTTTAPGEQTIRTLIAGIILSAAVGTAAIGAVPVATASGKYAKCTEAIRMGVMTSHTGRSGLLAWGDREKDG